MKNTTNYLLNKPDFTDFADIEKLNDNFDIIDKKIKEVDEKAGNIDLSSLQTQIDKKADKETVNAHLGDYVKHPAFVTVGGNANALTATVDGLIDYIDGMGIVIKVTTENTGAATIRINGLGSKYIRKSNGTALSRGNLKVGSLYTLRYNATTGFFILQGEGGEYGNVTEADVLTGKIFGTEEGLKVGILMPKTTPSTVPVSVPLTTIGVGVWHTLLDMTIPSNVENVAFSGGNIVLETIASQSFTSPNKLATLRISLLGDTNNLFEYTSNYSHTALNVSGICVVNLPSVAKSKVVMMGQGDSNENLIGFISGKEAEMVGKITRITISVMIATGMPQITGGKYSGNGILYLS